MVFFLSLTPISRVVACWSPAPGWLVKSITLSFTAGVCSRCLLFLWAGDLVKWLVCLPSKLTHALGTKYWKKRPKNTRSSTFSGIYWPHSIADLNLKTDHKPPIQPILSQILSLMICNDDTVTTLKMYPTHSWVGQIYWFQLSAGPHWLFVLLCHQLANKM